MDRVQNIIVKKQLLAFPPVTKPVNQFLCQQLRQAVSLIACASQKTVIATVDIISLQTPVKIAGRCNVKNK